MSTSVSSAALLAMGQSVLASQPFSVLLGAELHGLTRGQCELQIPLTQQLLQQEGFAHGGLISYAADNALTFAGGTALGVPVVTSEFKINYLRPVMGDRIVARASAVHTGKSQSVCRCDVFVIDESGERLCAIAQGTIAALPARPGGSS